MRFGRGGSMLVLGLWAVTLLGVFAISLGLGVRQRAALLNRLTTLDAVYPIAYSGVEQAKSLVRSDENFDVDLLGDTWAVAPREAAVVGGSFRLIGDGRSTVVDEERKVNLNHTSLEIAARLLASVSGLPKDEGEALAYNLLDWRDSDSNFGHPQHGAEDSYYEGLSDPYTAKDSPYEALDEILLVKGITPEVFETIKPFVTVHGKGPVNLNTAGSHVLAALGFSQDSVEIILAHRAGPDKQEGNSDDRFFRNPDTGTSDLQNQGGVALDPSQAVMLSGLVTAGQVGVSSSVFGVRSIGTLEKNGASVEVEAVFDRKSQVLYQRVGSVRWPART